MRSITLKHYSCIAAVVFMLLLASSAFAGQYNPDRDAYFGETHLHTSWSVDAYAFDNLINSPKEAYEFARGKPIKHPMGYTIKIRRPLDWMAVTDHSEYVGITTEANTPGSKLSKLPAAQPYILKGKTPEDFLKLAEAIFTLQSGAPNKQLNNPQYNARIWKKNIALADEAYKPGKFTTFYGYEWTSNTDYRNMHRTVYFRGGKSVERPYTALDSSHPEDLWKWMDEQREAGIELMASSHNANFSDGWMYPADVDSKGQPLTEAWSDARIRNERLTELKQTKGQSEVHPMLSPADKFAIYELISSFLIGQPETDGQIPAIVGSYVRHALKDGVTMRENKGYNPYKFGFIGGSDSHDGAGPYRQDNYFGDVGINNGTIETRMAGHDIAGLDARLLNPSGLTGVWAEENTRESIWDGLYRRETFATSGPAIKIRFFGDWNYNEDILDSKEWVKSAYAEGVTMGSDLPPAGAGAPSFIVWAEKDPTSGNLDRIQIVKGWAQNGQSYEKIYDVVWAGDRKADKWTGDVPPIQSTVDIDNATYKNTVGAHELKKVWVDPDFDPSVDAFYYARVLEIPTPRWTTIQAKQLNIAPPDVCDATVQERAWSTPIWYTPDEQARKKAKPALTVIELTAKGAAALDDKQLKEFIVGKAYFFINLTTGRGYKVRYDKNGTSLMMNIGKTMLLPGLTGNVSFTGYQEMPTPYSIKNGRIVTTVCGKPIELTAYKLGDRYYMARSNEYGYVNYEVKPKPPVNFINLMKGERQERADHLCR
ncbi:DUF3604 domain-containing protein [Candidatus Auribacterota bacterium]